MNKKHILILLVALVSEGSFIGEVSAKLLRTKAFIEIHDVDGDGIVAEKDNCPWQDNETQIDVDKDGKGDDCDDYKESISYNLIWDNKYISSDISGDGRYVVFEFQEKGLTDDDTNNFADVFLKDFKTGEITRISKAFNGSEVNGNSFEPKISANGKYVVFFSNTSNLVPNDFNNSGDVFLYDIKNKTISLISVNLSGSAAGDSSSDEPADITGDGKYIVFQSKAKDIAQKDPIVDNSTSHITRVILFDRSKNSLAVVNNTIDNETGKIKGAWFPSIDLEGNLITYISRCPSEVNDALTCIYLADLKTGKISNLISTIDGNAPTNSTSYGRISMDGHFVVFESEAINLVPNVYHVGSDIFLKNLSTDKISCITKVMPPGLTAEQENKVKEVALAPAHFIPDLSGSASITADNKFIAFHSVANNLVENDTNEEADIFVYDRTNDSTKRITMAFNGISEANSFSYYPSISADGNYVVFTSTADNLIPGAKQPNPESKFWALHVFGSGGGYNCRRRLM